MYTVYGIFDPITKLCVYVGETSDFERRKTQHLTTHRLRKAPPPGSIKAWLIKQHKAGREPIILPLEHVATNGLSLEAETRWIGFFSALGHPLHNLWDEHREMIIAHHAERYDALVFKGPKPMAVGYAEANANRTGYRVHLDKDADLAGVGVIDLLPPKDEDNA